MSASDEILSQISMSNLAQQLGTDEATAHQAAAAVLPTLLAGLTSEAADPMAGQQLAGALQRDHDGSLLDAENPLGSSDTDEGDRIVQHVFGNNRGDVENQLQGFLGGGGGGLVTKLLPLLAPLVMAWLSKKMAGGNRGGGGLGDVLGDILGGGSAGSNTAPGPGGGLGDILGGALGGGTSSRSDTSGGLGDILGQLGGAAGGGGGLDDLLGSILGGAGGGSTSPAGGNQITDVGDVFGKR